MSTKNFVSYGDAETLFTGVGNKISGKQTKPTTISYANWLLLTPQQQETGNWLVTGVPGADLSLRVLALETNKQDKTDNNLQTTSKETTGAINELKSGLTNFLKRGYFNIACQQGENVFNTANAQLVSGSFPDIASDCIYQIVNHGTSYSPPNVIEVDGSDTIIITATAAQNIQVMWVQCSNIPLTN